MSMGINPKKKGLHNDLMWKWKSMVKWGLFFTIQEHHAPVWKSALLTKCFQMDTQDNWELMQYRPIYLMLEENH